MKRVLMAMMGLVVALAGMLVAPAEKSYADHYNWHFGPEAWSSEDGYYELEVYPTSSEPNIDITIRNVWYRPYSSYTKYSTKNYSALSVRLCNPNTGNCTSWKKFDSYGSVVFTNMIGNRLYVVDIVDNWSNGSYGGTIEGIRY